MKSYTDIEQSRKLSEILPLESADMEYMFLKRDGSEVSNVPFVKDGFEKCEIVHIEHGKYYYCIKDYYAGGNKRASKGDVVQALNGMSMMALGVKANEYFVPVNTIKQMYAWSEEPDYSYNMVPCWSLAALLNLMKEPELIRTEGKWQIRVWYTVVPFRNGGYDNPVDACHEMILELHKFNLL